MPVIKTDARQPETAIRTEKRVETKSFRPFLIRRVSNCVAGRNRFSGVLDRNATSLVDPKRHSVAAVSCPRQRQPLEQRHLPAVDLQMRTLVIGEKPDDEIGAIGAPIGPDRRILRESGRKAGQGSPNSHPQNN